MRAYRRWLVAVAAVLLAAPAASGQEKEAEELFRKMEKRLGRATGMVAELEVTSDAKERTDVKARLTVAAGNKLKLSVTVTTPDTGEQKRWAFTLDGKQIREELFKPGKSEVKTAPAPATLAEHHLTIFGRAGLFCSFAALVSPWLEPEDRYTPDSFGVSEFTLAGKERVAGRETWVVGYTLTLPKEKGVVRCKVWLDGETHLPRKRVLECTTDCETVHVTETYTRLVTDARIDPNELELPK